MKISQLKTKSNNPRKIDQLQIEKLMQSIKDFPKMMELRPIVYDPVTMEVLGGNQRLTACKKLGMKDIPDSWTRSAETLSDDEKRRFVIQDNHQSGEWDFEIINAEWGDIDILQNQTNFENERTLIDEKDREIVPIERVHYLISVPIDMVIDIKEYIGKIKNIEGIEVEQSQN